MWPIGGRLRCLDENTSKLIFAIAILLAGAHARALNCRRTPAARLSSARKFLSSPVSRNFVASAQDRYEITFASKGNCDATVALWTARERSSAIWPAVFLAKMLLSPLRSIRSNKH